MNQLEKVLSILQLLVDNAVTTVTVSELSYMARMPKEIARKQLNILSKEGKVGLIREGNKSYWIIDIRGNSPYIPVNAESVLSTRWVLNSFNYTTMNSMANNHVRKITTPDTYARSERILKEDLGTNGFSVFDVCDL